MDAVPYRALDGRIWIGHPGQRVQDKPYHAGLAHGPAARIRAVVLAVPGQIADRGSDEVGVPAQVGAERDDRRGGHVDLWWVPADIGGDAAVLVGHPGQIGIPILDGLPVTPRVYQVQKLYAAG